MNKAPLTDRSDCIGTRPELAPRESWTLPVQTRWEHVVTEFDRVLHAGLSRRGFLAGATATGLAVLSPSASARDFTLDRRVLLVDIDDIGYELLDHAFSLGRAPALAWAMARGRTYPHFWAAPFCSQFRARVLTGLDAYRWGNRVGRVIKPSDSFDGPQGKWMPAGLQGGKVKIGKWHISNGPAFPAQLVLNGYDRFQGIRGNLSNEGGTYASWKEWFAEDGVVTEAWQDEHHTKRTAKLAIGEVERETEFIHVSFQAVHVPLENPPDGDPVGAVYLPGSDDELRLNMLQHLDYWFGRLLRTALLANYVVIVAADNGTDGDGKGSPKEHGCNTPFVVIGNGVLPGTSTRLVQATDLWSTVRRLRGKPLDNPKPDSFDFTDDFLTLAPIHEPRQFLTLDWFPGLGDAPLPDEWSRMIRDARWKYLDQKYKPGGKTHDPIIGLWDLEADPTEATNLLTAPLTGEAQAALEKLKAHLPS